ncbi:putative TLC domain-containing protein [Lachnellula suecica]|uniref:Putative TLC domain-containing protein n=1 Tax=Lachnellula suecica TaxID=602035 RepID=A0A8T9C1S9_9HELO|nr:putative TLC domain-containing protein [Lachnellula suecica]
MKRGERWIGPGGFGGILEPGGAVQGFAAGYFLWDLTASMVHLDVLGWGSLAHAVSALLVTSLGFISTPFLNIHWFCDKMKMTGSKLQLVNGVALLATFFCGRVLWGNYQSLNIYSDVWKSMSASEETVLSLGKGGITNASKLPVWLVFVYLGSNTILNFLNLYWFAKMVQALMKRFQPPSSSKHVQKGNVEKNMGGHID